MKSYETKVAGVVVCNMHARVSCKECSYVAELESEVSRLQDELAGDGVWTLTEQLSHLRSENDRLYNEASEYASIALWCAERLATRRDAEYAYDEIEKAYGYAIDRNWRGEQV